MANIYGITPVLEAFRSGKRRIERLYILSTKTDARIEQIERAARNAGVTIIRSDKSEIDRLARGQNHQGVVALLDEFQYADAMELIRSASAPALFVILDGVEDPHNLGAIIRTAEAAGASGLFIPERRAVHVTDVVSKTSAGAVDHLPVAIAQNINHLIKGLKKEFIWVVGIEPGAERPYTDWDWLTPTAIVLGSEGKGSRRLVRENCDALFSIPLRGHVQSLNVSVAAGVVLFEALRQRNGKV